MASCDSLRQNFQNPLPENPSLVDSIATWNHIKPGEPVELSSFSEIFGELHFKDTIGSSSLPFLSSFKPPSSSLLDLRSKPEIMKPSSHQERSCSEMKKVFSPSMNSESLNMCTEGLGFESFEDLEDGSGREKLDEMKLPKEKVGTMKHLAAADPYGERRRLRTFPPPIPSIGRNGKPWVSYKSFRCDGRLVLKEIMTSTHGQEFMHACREDGRLTLHLVHRDEEIQDDRERVKDEEREIMGDGEQVDHGKGKKDLDEISQNLNS